MVKCLPGPSARMCAVAPIVQHIFCGSHHSGSAAVRGGPGDRLRPDVLHLDDAPKGEDGKPGEEESSQIVWRAVWGMLYSDDAGVVSTSPRGLARMIDVVVVACQEFGLTVSENKNEAMHLWSNPSIASNVLRIEAEGR